MVEPDTTVSIRKQCELLNISRSGLYYEPVATSAEDLDLMRRIDELHLKWPHLGSRKLARELGKQGLRVNRKHVQRLMRRMDIVALVPQPDTSKPAPEHPVYPYLLRKLEISSVNQVWSTDITYNPWTPRLPTATSRDALDDRGPLAIEERRRRR